MNESEVIRIVVDQRAIARRERLRFERQIKDLPARDLRRLIGDPDLVPSHRDSAQRLLTDLELAEAAAQRETELDLQRRSVLAAEEAARSGEKAAKGAVDSARFARFAFFVSLIAIAISLWPLMFPKIEVAQQPSPSGVHAQNLPLSKPAP